MGRKRRLRTCPKFKLKHARHPRITLESAGTTTDTTPVAIVVEPPAPTPPTNPPEVTLAPESTETPKATPPPQLTKPKKTTVSRKRKPTTPRKTRPRKKDDNSK